MKTSTALPANGKATYKILRFTERIDKRHCTHHVLGNMAFITILSQSLNQTLQVLVMGVYSQHHWYLYNRLSLVTGLSVVSPLMQGSLTV